MSEREPMSEKVGLPYGDSPAKGIKPEGICINDFNGAEANREPMKEVYDHKADGALPIHNMDGIGEGKGGMSNPDKERFGAI